jgi:hypothetical protein
LQKTKILEIRKSQDINTRIQRLEVRIQRSKAETKIGVGEIGSTFAGARYIYIYCILLTYTNFLPKLKNPSFSISGINVASEDADKKWRNLKLTFKRIFYEEGRTEKSKSQWEFYDALLVLFSPEENDINAVRKSRTLSPPREDCKLQYEIDELGEMEPTPSYPPPVALKPRKIRPKKRKIEHYDDSAIYQIEELNNIDTDSITIEDRKPQIIQSFDIDFVDQMPVYTGHVQEKKPMRTEVVSRATINPLSPTPELVLNPAHAPVWFKNFQKRYDSDTKLMLTKLNNIREVQNTQQNCLNMLEHKLEIIEEKMIADANRDGDPNENSEYDEEDVEGVEYEDEEKEASMEEYYIEDE